ncbi:MAG: MBL fold metallo-hydrolase [Desulfovibrio sp.]|jgi:glyoxylase-like metal-dependent hydrolase (beta-lactamase superfamily II)|nr:MBL fold metallo-hydrolase [Desulfovibrio sp.]
MKVAEDIYFYEEAATSIGFSANSIVIDGDPKLIIDPGSEGRLPLLVKLMAADGLEVSVRDMAFFTHSHPDHLGAGRALADKFTMRPAMHRLEIDFLQGAGRSFWARPLFSEKDFIVLEAGEFSFGGHCFHLHHTPGHSPGSLTLHWPEAKLLVTGDVYFSGTFGATNLPGGDEPDMFRTLERLEALADVDLALCGHGPAVVGRGAVQENYRLLAREVSMKKAGLWTSL